MAGDEEDMDVSAPGVDDDEAGGSAPPPQPAETKLVHFGDAVHLDRHAADAAAGPLHGGGGGATAAAAAAPMSLDLPESSAAAVAKQAAALAEARARQRASLVAVPADDGAVRALLRCVLGEPVTLFGERQYERRDRARKLLAKMEPEEAARAVAAVTEGGVVVGAGVGVAGATSAAPSPFFVPLRPEEAQNELFYTEGSDELALARMKIALSSLEAAARRLHRERSLWETRRRRRERSEAARRRVEGEEEDEEAGDGAAAVADERGRRASGDGDGAVEQGEDDPDAASDAVAASARSSSSLRLLCSELGDGRPLSALSFDHRPLRRPSPPGSEGDDPSSSSETIGLAVGSWSGCASVWRADSAAGALLASSSWALSGRTGKSDAASASAASASSGNPSSGSWWRAHDDRVTGIAWRPFRSTSSDSSSSSVVDLATASADRTARLWSSSACALAAAAAPAGAPCSPKPLAELKGHAARLARLAWHPGFCRDGDDGGESGNGSGSGLLATASFDGSWRLWDAERAVSIVSSSANSDAESSCLLEQEGHSRAVYSLSWHRDGALLASAGLDAHARVWDVRTGKTACVLSGHAKAILSVDFDPSEAAATVATGAEDGCCRLWDLRSRGRPLATLPAHSSLVSTCRFLRTGGGRRRSDPPAAPSSSVAGRLLLTAGYDGEAKVWDASDGSLLKTLSGHESRVMSADVAALYPDDAGSGSTDKEEGSRAAVAPSLLVATSAYDRTLKLWGRLD